MCFWPDQPQNWSDYLKNGDLLGRKWRGWSRYQFMISEPVLVNLSYEVILKFKWQPCVFDPDHPQNWTDYIRNGDWLGRKWRDGSRYQFMISEPVVVNLSYEIILKFKWCSSVYNNAHMCFWPDQPQHWSDYLKNRDWLGRKWCGWDRNQTMISKPVVVNLYYGLILKFKWCNPVYNHTHMCFGPDQPQN